VRLHTHLAETVEEEHYCLERFGLRPLEYLAELGWLGDDVWFAHCIHLDDAEVRQARRHRLGRWPTVHSERQAGRRRPRRSAALLAAGLPVGLGVDGSASNEDGRSTPRCGTRCACAAGDDAKAMTARAALALGTIHGARCLAGSTTSARSRLGKLADVALWRLDGSGTPGSTTRGRARPGPARTARAAARRRGGRWSSRRAPHRLRDRHRAPGRARVPPPPGRRARMSDVPGPLRGETPTPVTEPVTAPTPLVVEEGELVRGRIGVSARGPTARSR
jgi:hypothetical protein